jgi:hypothetical protein
MSTLRGQAIAPDSRRRGASYWRTTPGPFEKNFQDKKPLTLYRLTPRGRKALSDYIAALKQLLGNAI